MGHVGAMGARPMGGGMNMGGMPHQGMPNMSARPQMPSSRPSMGNMSRPQMPNISPGAGSGANRPFSNPSASRPSLPSTGGMNLGSNRPSLSGGIGSATNKLPGSSGNNFGSGIKPGFGDNRPTAGLGTTRPSFPNSGSKPNIKPPGPLNPATKPAPMPGGGSGIASRPGNISSGLGGTRPADRPSLGGATKPAPAPGNVNRPGQIGGGNFGQNNRPNIGDNRPSTLPGNIGQNNRPNINQNNRPNIGGNRPNPLPGNIGQNNRPNIGGTRPGQGGSGTWGNGSWGNGSWGNLANNRPGFNNNNININNNNFNNIHNNMYNRPSWDRPNGGWNGNNWNNNWHDHWYDNAIRPHYHGWYNGCWGNYWGSAWYSPLAWGAVGWGLGSLANSYYTPYVNPYYVAVPTVTTSVPYDYSQPVVINNYITPDTSSASVSPSAIAAAPASSDAATQDTSPSVVQFDQGLANFKRQDYQGALKAFDSALKLDPKDPVVHEVRALTLFALGDYQQAAAVLNSLLSSAPGMDWTTMSGLYGDADNYTPQLRKLEQYCVDHPTDAPSHFVLAYHYLVIGSKDDAVDALKIVVTNQPKDVTAKRMLDALTPPASGDSTKAAPAPTPVSSIASQPTPAANTSTNSQPETDLVGTWFAAKGKSTIDLKITEDSKFQWQAKDDGKTVAELNGDLTTSPDSITLETTDKGSLGGSVVSKGMDAWVFLPPGTNSEADGIAFNRKK